ncbi:hypothetical protein D9758_008754 [Tetrapyrgos nigripes]|uniref:Protein kinase domain-containing protein n=1 Tax=Tetrapyrgos nigripes TaxID=182062 RepID=A0A8H5D4Q0_9AGAR|nr:hypothetical protein D9758_008754 [Tetrapyrgos nigripes]
MLQHASSSLCSELRRQSPFEPDAVWKQDLKKRIWGRLVGMIEEAKVLHEEYVRNRPKAKAKLEEDFQHVMTIVDKMVDEAYRRELELERDRRERTMSAGDGSIESFEQEQSLLDMLLNSGEITPPLSQSHSFNDLRRKSSSSHDDHPSPMIRHKSRTVFPSNTRRYDQEELPSSDSGSDGQFAAWSLDFRMAAKRKERVFQRSRHSAGDSTGTSPGLSDNSDAHSCISPSSKHPYQIWRPPFIFFEAGLSPYPLLNADHRGATALRSSPPAFTSHDAQSGLWAITRFVGSSARAERERVPYRRRSSDKSASPPTMPSSSSPSRRSSMPPVHSSSDDSRHEIVGTSGSQNSAAEPTCDSVGTPGGPPGIMPLPDYALQDCQSAEPEITEYSCHSSQQNILSGSRQAWRLWLESELHQASDVRNACSEEGHSCSGCCLEYDQEEQPGSKANSAQHGQGEASVELDNGQGFQDQRDLLGRRRHATEKGQVMTERDDSLEKMDHEKILSKFPVVEEEEIIYPHVRAWKIDRIVIPPVDSSCEKKQEVLVEEQEASDSAELHLVEEDFEDDDVWGSRDLQKIEEELGRTHLDKTSWISHFFKSSRSKHSPYNFTEDPNTPISPLGGPGPSKIDAVLKQLEWILSDKPQYKRLLSQRGELAQSLLDLLQTLSDYPALNARLRSKISAAMIRLAKKSELYPSCLALKNIQRVGEFPVAGGGFGEVWKGLIGKQMGCLKVVKIYDDSDIQLLLKDFLKEAILWRQLDHPNILPFLGLYFLDECKKRLCLVSPWMENGNARQYLNKNSEKVIDRTLLVYDVANGLSYLHARKIVHGDLKAVNILISATGRALVADFGLSRLVDSGVLKWSSLSTQDRVGGTTRWLAPECLLRGSRLSYKSDIYAFGCVCYEILTGLIPFHEIAQDAAVVFRLIDRKRPIRPLTRTPHLTDSMWVMMEECWAEEPCDRPEAHTLPVRISRLSGQSMAWAEPWDDDLLRSSHLWSNLCHPELIPSNVESFLFGTCLPRLS